MTIARESQNMSEAIFVGGGEMGALMRNSFGVAPRSHDWSNTVL